MKKELAQQHIEQHLDEADNLIGFFFAVQPFKIWLFFLIGPLAVLSMKYYFVAVTDNGMTFHHLNWLGKFAANDHFAYDEIECVKIGKGWIQRPMKFKFINGRKLTLKATIKGVERVAKLTDSLQQHFQSRIKPG